jgi:hypothetical protein
MSDEVLKSPWLIAVVSGLIAALITQGLTWWREIYTIRKQNKAKATFAAIVTATKLERFAMDCWDAIGNIKDYRSSNGNIGNKFDQLPDEPKYPDNVEWISVGSTLCVQVFSFSNEIEQSHRLISFMSDVTDPDTAADEVIEQCATRGSQALALATQLRQHYAIPPLVHGKFNFEEKLSDELRIVRAAQERHDISISTNS